MYIYVINSPGLCYCKLENLGMFSNSYFLSCEIISMDCKILMA